MFVSRLLKRLGCCVTDSMTKYELKRTGYGTEATRDFNWNYLKNWA